MASLSVSAHAERQQTDDLSTYSLPRNAQIVLEALRGSPEPMKAYALLEKLQDQGINAPMTVYRALDRLIAEGLVRKIGNLNAYAALPGTSGDPIAFIICRRCSHTAVEAIDPAGVTWLQSLNLKPEDVSIEAFRDCQGCDHCNNKCCEKLIDQLEA